MPVVNNKNWAIVTQADNQKKGKLVRITLSDGRTVKMYEADAIKQGYLKAKPGQKNKIKPPGGNKLAPPGGDKVETPPPDGQPATPPAEDFTAIDGVGPATARALVAHGITTFEELEQAVEGDPLDYLSASVNQSLSDWRESLD